MEYEPLSQLISLSGKSAIVTGGAMGIGYGIAYRLAEAGAGVIIADRNKPAADAAAEKLVAKRWKAVSVQTDVENAADVKTMIDTAVREYSSVDILVNNAGIYPVIPVMELEQKHFELILAVNLKGVFLCSKAAAAQMIAQGKGGKIINITSVDAIHPSMVGLAAYDATKHGVWGFTQNLALELAPQKISVNAIAPGGINTPGTGVIDGKPVNKEAQALMAHFLKTIPMQRMGEPDDIGKVALFLASDLSNYMTGSQIVVDGGKLLS